ncbi:MAG: hypothetical protein ACREIE_06975, partial [Nitrospiraceae bacterium]
TMMIASHPRWIAEKNSDRPRMSTSRRHSTAGAVIFATDRRPAPQRAACSRGLGWNHPRPAALRI